MIRNIIFDLDGTLLDTSKGIIESIKHTIHVMDLSALTEDELKSFIGPPLKKSFMNICGCSEERDQPARPAALLAFQDIHSALPQGLHCIKQALPE